MELTEYREYLRRADAAESVRDLHRIANEALIAHPGDPDAEAIERACFDQAESIIARSRRHHHAPPPPPKPAADDDDWKARAAQM